MTARAEKLIKIHPWAGQARFARSGGEANAIAVRIARAYSKKEKIAFCGYHGWHDWYLATNLRKSNNLDDHLLKGLKVGGVQKNLKNIFMIIIFSLLAFYIIAANLN